MNAEAEEAREEEDVELPEAHLEVAVVEVLAVEEVVRKVSLLTRPQSDRLMLTSCSTIGGAKTIIVCLTVPTD